ncbi:MAG: type II secretion system F family protein [Clostridiales Family XIII bacterium]|jgi:tight adherence protein B|nr:type II secretion system F family protein [Clostridiales Family XIII bacterium]
MTIRLTDILSPGAGAGRESAGTGKEDAAAMTDYRCYEMSPRETRRYYAAACTIAAALGMLFYHNAIAAALLALAALPCKKYYRAYLAARRRSALSVQFKDLLASLSSSFMTGRQMTEALSEAEKNLAVIYDESAPIMKEISLIVRRLTSGRESEREVLFDFAARSASDDIEGFVDVYFTCLTTGGDTIVAVRRATELIMDKLTVRNEIAALTAQKRFEAKILAALPPLILVFLQLASPDYIAPLYGTAAGMLVMTLCLAIMGAAFYWSSRITDIEV